MRAINECVRRSTDEELNEELIRGLLSDAVDIAVTLDGRLMKKRLFYSKFQFCRENMLQQHFFQCGEQ